MYFPQAILGHNGSVCHPLDSMFWAYLTRRTILSLYPIIDPRSQVKNLQSRAAEHSLTPSKRLGAEWNAPPHLHLASSSQTITQWTRQDSYSTGIARLQSIIRTGPIPNCENAREENSRIFPLSMPVFPSSSNLYSDQFRRLQKRAATALYDLCLYYTSSRQEEPEHRD